LTLIYNSYAPLNMVGLIGDVPSPLYTRKLIILEEFDKVDEFDRYINGNTYTIFYPVGVDEDI
jgi:hypothetical protein